MILRYLREINVIEGWKNEWLIEIERKRLRDEREVGVKVKKRVRENNVREERDTFDR